MTHKDQSWQQRNKGVTLAICTHNGKAKLEPTIQHVLTQDIPSHILWELLLIDNASTDGTAEFVKKMWPEARNDQLRIIREEKLGAIHARSRAIREARYSYLSYIDDDNWISPNWVADVYHIFETHPNVGLISCPSTAHLSEPPPDHFEVIKGWLAIGEQCAVEGIIHKRPISFWTAGCSFRIEAFELLYYTGIRPCLTGREGDRPLGGEDHELCLLLTMCGWDVYFSQIISFRHEIPRTRLLEATIKNLIYHSVKCYPILDIYRDFYRKRRTRGQARSFFYYFYYYIERLIALVVKKIVLHDKGITPNQISYLIAKGSFVGFIGHRQDFHQAITNIHLAMRIYEERKYKRKLII